MEARETKSFYSPKKIYQKGLYHIPIGSWLEFPLEVYLSVYGGAAFAINVAAEGETYVEALGRFEGDAGGDGHAVATIGFDCVGNGGAWQVGQLVAGFAIVAE